MSRRYFQTGSVLGAFSGEDLVGFAVVQQCKQYPDKTMPLRVSVYKIETIATQVIPLLLPISTSAVAIAHNLNQHLGTRKLPSSPALLPVSDGPLLPEDVAEVIWFALSQPWRVNVNEILLRPTGQVN